MVGCAFDEGLLVPLLRFFVFLLLLLVPDLPRGSSGDGGVDFGEPPQGAGKEGCEGEARVVKVM